MIVELWRVFTFFLSPHPNVRVSSMLRGRVRRLAVLPPIIFLSLFIPFGVFAVRKLIYVKRPAC